MKYLIAGMHVEMDVEFEPLLSQAKPYLCDDDKEYIKLVKDHDEKVSLMHNYHKEFPHLDVGTCEYMLYGYAFYKELIKHNGILLHASCVIKDSYAYLFCAKSGGGKSTHTSLWLKYIEGSFILNDDKPAIICFDKVYACGTPFSGKTNLNVNSKYEVKGICFLNKSKENSIKEIDKTYGVYNLLNNSLSDISNDELEIISDTLNTIISNTKIYEMGCNISKDACIMSYNKMKE